jgi:hypothetical protein
MMAFLNILHPSLPFRPPIRNAAVAIVPETFFNRLLVGMMKVRERRVNKVRDILQRQDTALCVCR